MEKIRQVNLLQKGNADGPPYELRNAGIIIILFWLHSWAAFVLTHQSTRVVIL